MSGGDAAGRPGRALGHNTAQIDQVFHRAGHAAGAAQDDLIVAGGLEHTGLHVIDGIVDHTRIEHLDLRLDVALLNGAAQLFQEAGRVFKNGAVLPVQGARVIGAQLGQQLLDGLDALLVGAALPAGGGDVDAHVAVLVGADAVHNILIQLIANGGGSVRLPGVNVNDGRPCLPAIVGLVRNLLRGVGDGGVHILGGPGPAQGGGDNALVLQVRHKLIPPKNF